MLSWTKHGDAVQFSTLLIHESRQHRDLFLKTRWFTRLRDRANEESWGKRQIDKRLPQWNTRYFFVKCAMLINLTADMRFRLKKKFSFVNKKISIATVLRCKFRLYETIGRKKISSGIFSHLNVYATTPFPLSRWERHSLLNQYEQYFRRLQRARARTLFLLQRTHSIDCHKNLHYWYTVFS